MPTLVSLVVAVAIGGLSYFYLGKDLLLAAWTALASSCLSEPGLLCFEWGLTCPAPGASSAAC